MNSYAFTKAETIAQVWMRLYAEMEFQYQISINKKKCLANESKLKMLIRLGYGEPLYRLALQTLRLT